MENVISAEPPMIFSKFWKGKRLKLLFSFGVGIALTGFFFFWIVCGFDFNFKLPLNYSGDVFLAVLHFKSLALGEWFPYFGVRISAVGAPFGAELNDFAGPDHLHFLLIKFFSLFSHDPFVLFNAYYLFGFIATTASLIYVAHRLRMPYAVGVVLGVLYSFMTYHLMRYPHLFLASYYLLPLSAWVTLQIWFKKPLFYRLGTESKFHFDVRTKNAVFALVLSFLLGAGGVYYAFFSAMFFAAAGVSAALYRKSSRHLFSSFVLIGVIVFSLGLCGIPNAIYIYKHGKNRQVAHRSHTEVEIQGLKLANIIYPRFDHRIAKFREIRAKYQGWFPPVEGFHESVGLVALLGFILILGRLSMLRTRNTGLDKISILWLVGVFFSVIGGLPVLFALLISSQLRCYNRISIFLALFGLMAVGFVLKDLRKRVPYWIWAGVLAAVFLIGVYDQITPDYQSAQTALAGEFYSDQRYFQKIEQLAPVGAMILQLPYAAFPESGTIHEMADYSHFRGYFHTQALRWSYGIMRGRHGDEEIKKVSELPLNLKAVRAMGYRGIYIDRSGFKDHAKSLEAHLIHELRAQPVVSENNRMSYFNL